MEEPSWLEGLLRTKFFSSCPQHPDTQKNECNMFCLSCPNAAFCSYCRSSSHIDHHVLQIRRSSYQDVVRASDIGNVLDIRGVQTYIINGASVVFLNKRPQSTPNSSRTISYHCETCSRNLFDHFRFCSLGCKVEGMRKSKKEEEEEKDKGTPHPPTRSSNSRRRKGTPHRAPLGN